MLTIDNFTYMQNGLNTNSQHYIIGFLSFDKYEEATIEFLWNRFTIPHKIAKHATQYSNNNRGARYEYVNWI